MSKHPTFVKGFKGSLDELAQSIGNMTYDQTASIIEKLANDLTRQGNDDLNIRQRKKLATQLYKTANKLYEASDEMYKAWEICKPYMNQDDKNEMA
ncbi:hypothetical protein JXM83_01365 [Candidatus Woesearchaeota archaeon]|nr:hypothetical protein [Candidatus Woesearchaeota archaeon]